MDPISPLLNMNQNQEQPPAPPPALALSETLHGNNLLVKSGQSAAVPVSRALRTRRARRGHRKNVAWEGRIHPGQLAAVKRLFFTLWMRTTCAPHTPGSQQRASPRVPGRRLGEWKTSHQEVFLLVQIHMSTEASTLQCLGLRAAKGEIAKAG